MKRLWPVRTIAWSVKPRPDRLGRHYITKLSMENEAGMCGCRCLGWRSKVYSPLRLEIRSLSLFSFYCCD